MHEESSNLRRITRRIEQGILASRKLITAIESFSFAPSPAAGQILLFRDGVAGLGHEVCSICNELAIDSINGLQRAFNLRRRVIAGLQAAYRRFDQNAELRNVLTRRLPDGDALRHGKFFLPCDFNRMFLAL